MVFFWLRVVPLKDDGEIVITWSIPLQKIPASDMQIVYTQAEKGILADALSTALFTMGFAKAKAMLSNIPGEAMVWGKTSEEIFISPGFRGILYAE
jgi:thiamine biosynthesis lipoprotein ApbE